MNDWILIEQLKQGDEAAFKSMVETFQSMVYNTALSIVQNAEDAEDIAQEVFVQVYQSVQSFKGESKFSTWLYRITISKSLDHERRKKRKKRFAFIRSLTETQNESPVQVSDFHHPGVVLDWKENAAIVFKAIRALPTNQRISFTLHKVEGLSYKEISEVMETSISSVESLIHRARNNLKKILGNYYSKRN